MGISGVVLLPFLLFPFPLFPFPFPAPWVSETTVQKKMRDNVKVFMILQLTTGDDFDGQVLTIWR
jgi:hypothetical protein